MFRGASRQTGRQADRQTGCTGVEKLTGKQFPLETGIFRGADRHKDRQTDRWTECSGKKKTDRQQLFLEASIFRGADRQTGRQADRQTDGMFRRRKTDGQQLLPAACMSRALGNIRNGHSRFPSGRADRFGGVQGSTAVLSSGDGSWGGRWCEEGGGCRSLHRQNRRTCNDHPHSTPPSPAIIIILVVVIIIIIVTRAVITGPHLVETGIL